MKNWLLVILVVLVFTPAFVFATNEKISFDPELDVGTYTGNPNECWFENENGEIEPCKIDHGLGLGFAIFVILYNFWPVILATSLIITGFYLYKNKKQSLSQIGGLIVIVTTSLGWLSAAGFFIMILLSNMTLMEERPTMIFLMLPFLLGSAIFGIISFVTLQNMFKHQLLTKKAYLKILIISFTIVMVVTYSTVI